jgi:hypothetical protein
VHVDGVGRGRDVVASECEGVGPGLVDANVFLRHSASVFRIVGIECSSATLVPTFHT